MNSEGTAGDENIIVENIITPNDGEDFGIFDSSKIESEVIKGLGVRRIVARPMHCNVA